LEILDYSYDPGLGRIEINFVVYREFDKYNAIRAVSVKISGDNITTGSFAITDPNQTTYVRRNLPFEGTRCYQLSLVVGEDAGVRPTEEICIEL